MDHLDIELKYGQKSFILKLPDNIRSEVLVPQVRSPSDTPSEMIVRALHQPIATPPLSDLAKGRQSAVILVSGKTRVTGSAQFLPWIMSELNASGLSARQVTIIFATGTHEKMTPQDIRQVVGETLAGQVRVIGHDCHNPRQLVEVGETAFHNRIFVSTTVSEADLKILTGRITHHYFAGFTGGSKSILPGVCGFESILHNHRMVMSVNGGADPRATHGNVEDNPVHADMVGAAELVRPDFVFNTVLDHQHRLQHCVAGHHIAAHLKGCRLADHTHRRYVNRPAELVVASCGGYPYDVNFMQSIKTIFNCEKILTPGGTLILIAECPKGIKAGFLRWFAHPDFDDLDQAVLADYDLTGHNTYLIRRFLQQHRIIMVTSLPTDQVRQLGFIPAQNIKEALGAANFQACSLIYVVPFGGATLLEVGGPNDERKAYSN